MSPAATSGVGAEDLLGLPTEYQPELWTVKKDDIYAAIHAVQNGLDYARECLITHNSNLGRTTLKNRTWAERMEEDIRRMEGTLTALRLCPNVLSEPRPGDALTKQAKQENAK